MPQIFLQCKTCNKVFPSGISMGKGASATFIDNKSRCPHCGSWESIPDGTFRATVDGFIKILQDSGDPLQDAKNILEGLEKAKETQDLSKVPFNERVESFLANNKVTIAVGIAVLKILIDLLTKQPDIEITNNIINQEFYQQYNQTIDITLDE